MKTNKKYISLLLTAALLLGLCAGFAPAAYAAGVDITGKFTDPGFKAAVYEVIGKSAPAPILDSDVANVTYLDAGDRDIKSLAGLEYFTGLETLYCGNNQLTTLPALPSGLIEFICWENQLTTLPALPSGLKELYCGSNPLHSLPALPSGLTVLSCYDNQLTSLPALPSGLTFLGCADNQLTSVPALPSGLTVINCGNNELTSLPALPSGLTQLFCYGNQLSALPVLSSGLTILDCGSNPLHSLPALPSGLTDLWCYENQLTSLPTLPSGLTALSCGVNEITSLPGLPTGLTILYCFANRLTGLNLSGLSALEFVDCSMNDLADPSAVKGFAGVWNSENFVFEPQNSGNLPLVGLSSWAVDEAASLNDRGIIPTALKNSFQTPIRRDEFTAMLVRCYENATGDAMYSDESPFLDIESCPYKSAIIRAYNYGLVDGTSPTKFTPDGLLTREQTAKLLYTMVNIVDGAELGSGAPSFTDNAAISDWARPYVAWCQQNNVMQGTATGKFDPLGNLTREQAMLVCERLIVQFGW